MLKNKTHPASPFQLINAKLMIYFFALMAQLNPIQTGGLKYPQRNKCLQNSENRKKTTTNFAIPKSPFNTQRCLKPQLWSLKNSYFTALSFYCRTVKRPSKSPVGIGLRQFLSYIAVIDQLTDNPLGPPLCESKKSECSRNIKRMTHTIIN